MANTTAICSSFKNELLQALHNFGTTVVRAGTGADTFKGALFLTTASLGAVTATYSATGEVSGTGYTAGGATVTNLTPPTLNGTESDWTPSASLSWAGLTLSTAFDTLLLYNSSQANRAVAVFNFGSNTITAGTLTLSMPANTAGNALLRLA